MKITSKMVDDDYPSPKKIYDDLISRCKEVQVFYIRCILDESWVGIAPFNMTILDGVFTCEVYATSYSEAIFQMVEKLPIIKFLDEEDEE